MAARLNQGGPRAGALTPEESAGLLKRYKETLDGFTYLIKEAAWLIGSTVQESPQSFRNSGRESLGNG